MIKIGAKVKCQYYNTPDKRFYGETFEAEVIEITTSKGNFDSNYNPKRDYVLKRLDDGRIITVWRKEIIKILK
jgi:hypothetical protein